MKTIPILFTFDEKLLIPAGVCISSLLSNAQIDTFYDIFILHGKDCDFSTSKLTELPQKFHNCNIRFREVKDEFIGAYEIRGIPETAYYRLISPELIPEYDKILYSDVDVIFREDQSRFYNLNLGDNYFAAVDNCSAIRPDVQDYLAKELGLDYHNGYFYSGNLIINSAKILKNGITKKFRELGQNKYVQQDMDIMNIACNGHIMRLGPSFCLTNYLYDLIVNRRDEMLEFFSDEELTEALVSGIVHYNGAKPWKEACMNMDIWWEYYRKSIFFDEQFCYEFWNRQCRLIEDLSFMKKIKLLVRHIFDMK